MKYWSETIEDAFSCFQWFSEDQAKKMIGYVPEISVFSMIGSMIFSSGDRDLFMRLCSESLARLATAEEPMNEYRFFLFGVVSTHDINSKIVHYQKLWKKTAKEFNLDHFTLGPEIETNRNGRLHYASIAEFKVEDFYCAIQIMESNPQQYALFWGRKPDYMGEAFIKTLFDQVYVNEEVDYFKLALAFCQSDELLFRWGNSSEECELDIITGKENMKKFDGFTLGS